MLRRTAQVAGSFVVGAAADRLSQARQDEKPAQPSQPSQPLRTGNEILGGLSSRVKVPDDAQSPLVQGAMSQVRNRVNLAEKVGALAKDPTLASHNASKVVDGVKEDVKFLQGAAKIAQHGELSAQDGVRVARAGVQLAENSVLASAKALYAGATTSKEKVEELGQSVAGRASHEAKAVAVGVAASQGIAAAVGIIPHPAAKIAAATIRVTGQAAAGAKVSEAARSINADVAGPIRKEVVAIAKEKS